MSKEEYGKADYACRTTGRTWGYICLGLILVMAILAVIYTPWFFIGAGLVFIGLVAANKLTKT